MKEAGMRGEREGEGGGSEMHFSLPSSPLP